MKYLILFLTFILSTSYTFSESLNVITGNPDSTIFVNGVNLGQEAVYNHQVQPGTYHIKIMNNKDTIFSEVVTVRANEVTTIDTLNFVKLPKSNLPDKGPEKMATKRLRQLKGNIGVGFQVGYVSGLSINTIFNKFRLGVMGWKTLNNSNHRVGELRLTYVIKDKLPIVDKLCSLYAGAGIGNKKNTKSPTNINESFTEIILGADFPAKYGFWNIEAGYGFIKNYSDPMKTKSLDGLLGKLGYHYYF